MACAVQNTRLQHQLQGDEIQSLLTVGSGPCGLCILIMKAGSRWFYTMQTGMDAGGCTSVQVGSFSRGRCLGESWIRGSLTVERPGLFAFLFKPHVFVFCYRMSCQGVT